MNTVTLSKPGVIDDTGVLDWLAMDEAAKSPNATTDPRDEFEDQALPFMDQLYGAAMRMTR